MDGFWGLDKVFPEWEWEYSWGGRCPKWEEFRMSDEV